MIKRSLFGLVLIPALVAGMWAFPANAQSPSPDVALVPAVEVHPIGTTREDPNGGQWFVTSLEFGETQSLQARFFNPAEVTQTVKLYLADIRFDDQGIPEVTNVATDVGTWGRFDHTSITIEPKQNVVESFTITAPQGADPGDHVGAVVVEQTPQGAGLVRSVKRLAVRLYATLPGDARKQFEIAGVTSLKDSWFFTRELAVTVHLKNTGRVRLEPTVKVGSREARGPELLMSQATERYLADRGVPFWGGPVRLTVNATSRTLGIEGPAQQMHVTVWVIPWHLFVLLGLLAGLYFGGRQLVRRRGGKYRSLQSDLQRIERLVTKQHEAKPDADDGSDANADAQAAIVAAVKQARRAGDMQTAERLEALLKRPANAQR